MSADEYEYPKSAALSKQCNPSRDPAKHRKGHFPPNRTENGLSGTEKFSA